MSNTAVRIEPARATANQSAADQAAANQAAANQANAQHSTGPRTPAGKARSAMNALRHGLTALSPVLPSEDLDAYNRHVQEFVNDYQPTTATERQLTRELADTAWRINRLPALEASIFAIEAPAGSVNTDVPDLESCLAVTEALREQERALKTLSTHGHRLSRQFQKVLDQLIYLQYERVRAERTALQDCSAIYKVHQDKGLPYNPADDGFVFSTEELERHIATQLRRGMSRNMVYGLHSHPEMLIPRPS